MTTRSTMPAMMMAGKSKPPPANKTGFGNSPSTMPNTPPGAPAMPRGGATKPKTSKSTKKAK